jgi:hypothetical protein
METPMKSVNKICMSVLMLGAAAIAVPAMAQDANTNAGAAESAQPAAPSNDNAAQAAGAPNESSQANAAADASTSPSAAPSTSTKTAMNSSADAAANANVSSVGDTSKKYHRASRAKDFAAEQKITEQLNQQANAAAKPTQTASNQ